MTSLKRFIAPAKILAFALSLLIFCFNSAAIALPNTLATVLITENAQIIGGKLSVNTTTPSLPATTVIRSAKLFLAKGETGIINKIKITDGNGLAFGCQDIKVKDGIDLIKACGGPAVLEAAGPLTYVAEGSNFAPKLNTRIKVVLTDDFQP
jgi:hypothetical protein